jgi:hypothetical protein
MNTPPLPTLSPSRGERALLCVIASAAKQPRGLKQDFGDVPLGCFGVSRLAMTQKTSVCGRGLGEGLVSGFSVFPAKAGNKNVSLNQDAAHRSISRHCEA